LLGGIVLKNNRNVSELWWDTDSDNSIKTIREIYRFDGKIDKCYSISIVNGFKFSAYSDGAITSPFVVFDFDIDHPLFFPFYNLLNGSTELFIDDDFDFTRIGYVSSYKHTNVEKSNFINNVFIDKKMITSDFQLSWYKEELIDSVRVNVWERHITDLLNGVEFVSIFDINTPINEKNNINFDFIEHFLKKCDKFIVDRINDRF
jgi:hypothetical protein